MNFSTSITNQLKEFLFVTLIFGLIFSYFMQNEKTNCENTKSSLMNRPKFITYDYSANSKNLINVEDVLLKLGLEKIELQSKGLTLENLQTDWDLLWSWEHHKYINYDWSKLKFYQKINNWPGNRVLASKSVLTTTTNSKYVPKAFLTPESVQKYAKNNPDKKFVIKLKSSRGIQIVDPKDMNFTNTNSINDYFAQEFIANPLLWNGHKFDFAIYVALTSVDPLRLYYYEKNVFLRFCKKPYNISNLDDIDSYVIADDHILAETFEGVEKFVENDFTYKDAFESFMISKGAKMEDIWEKVEDLIRSVVISNEEFIVDEIAQIKSSKYNYFELFRFDMIFDENFNLHLIEINQSPNLNAPRSDRLNKILYKNVLYNIFNLIGVGTTYEKTHFKFPSDDVYWMVADPSGMTVKPQFCMECKDCDEKCSTCWHCMDTNEKYDVLQGYKEQMNVGDFKRIFPPEKEFLDKVDEEFWEKMSETNQKYVKWYREMCEKNKRFC